MTPSSRHLGLGISAAGLAAVVGATGVALAVSSLAGSTDASAPQTAKPQAASPFSEKAEFMRYAERLRESVLLSLEPEVRIPSQPASRIPSTASPSFYSGSASVSSRYPWKNKIVTTVFWVGESASTNNPVHNRSSSWDLKWKESFGGFDNPDPTKRRGYFPSGFIPRLNPFYCALPYNDVRVGSHKPEARQVIPWFKDAFVRDGQSVCRDRWVAIRNNSGRVCYAQWSDCGPFRTDHWEYVFGRDRPAQNLNGGAGLDVSPAVRDYLQINSIDVTDWKFVEAHEIPRGPWAEYGENNDFVQQSRRSRDRMATSTLDSPRVFVR
ncbi:MAG: hypothetical protein EBS01_11330 [Verrucomicrobia bacterium]|nr:hypothetical protein [Verrucomicrobiota bacterium]